MKAHVLFTLSFLHLSNAASTVTSELHSLPQSLSSALGMDNRQLSNVSVDLVTLLASIAGAIILLLLVAPVLAFLAELKSRLLGGSSGGYDKIDDDYYYDYSARSIDGTR